MANTTLELCSVCEQPFTYNITTKPLFFGNVTFPLNYKPDESTPALNELLKKFHIPFDENKKLLCSTCFNEISQLHEVECDSKVLKSRLLRWKNARVCAQTLFPPFCLWFLNLATGAPVESIHLEEGVETLIGFNKGKMLTNQCAD